MPTAQRNPSKALFQSLKGLGFTQSSINAVLPSWWDESLASDPSGLAELKVLLARRLSIEPASLFGADEAVQFVPVVRLYKGGRDDLMDQLRPTTAIAGSIGRTVLNFVGDKQTKIPKDPLTVRRHILDSGAKWVGLDELLALCWNSGIPVVHATFPSNLQKFDALVMTEGGRFSIVLSRNEGSIAWLAFHLAHEIGHIACGHLGQNAMLVDEKVDDDMSGSTQAQEKEANDYALKLLGGDRVELPSIDRRASPTKIARMAQDLGAQYRVLPGHLILKAGKRDSMFPMARQALAFFEGQRDARKVINEYAAQQMSAAGWTDEAKEFVQKFALASKV
jgi:hypothetical protein